MRWYFYDSAVVRIATDLAKSNRAEVFLEQRSAALDKGMIIDGQIKVRNIGSVPIRITKVQFALRREEVPLAFQNGSPFPDPKARPAGAFVTLTIPISGNGDENTGDFLPGRDEEVSLTYTPQSNSKVGSAEGSGISYDLAISESNLNEKLRFDVDVFVDGEDHPRRISQPIYVGPVGTELIKSPVVATQYMTQTTTQVIPQPRTSGDVTVPDDR